MDNISKINLSKLTICVILGVMLLNSCSVTKSKSDRYSQRFIEEKLAIKKVVRWKNHNSVDIFLIDNTNNQLTQGYNFVTHPVSNKRMGLFLNIKNKKEYSIQRVDTVIQANEIKTYVWRILKKESMWGVETTDLEGNFIHAVGYTWFIGKGHGTYSEARVVDSLGNTSREWGYMNSNKKKRSRN